MFKNFSKNYLKKVLIGSIACLFAINAQALSNLEIYSLVNCNSSIEPKFIFDSLKSAYGEPKVADGAYWFNATGQLYETNIKSVFLSATPNVSFFGVVLDATPDKLAETIKQSRVYPTNMFPTSTEFSGSYFVGGNGNTLMWHEQKFSKIFCAIAWHRF